MKKKIILIIIAVVIVLGAVGGGIYLYYHNKASADCKVTVPEPLQPGDKLLPIVQAKMMDIMVQQNSKYKNGNCLPRYKIEVSSKYTIFKDKIYVRISVYRRKFDKAVFNAPGANCQNKCCAVYNDKSETETFDFVLNTKTQKLVGGTPPCTINCPCVWVSAGTAIGDSSDGNIEIPSTCCQVGPTTTPPSPTPTASWTPTTTPYSPTPTPSYSWTPTPSH